MPPERRFARTCRQAHRKHDNPATAIRGRRADTPTDAVEISASRWITLAPPPRGGACVDAAWLATRRSESRVRKGRSSTRTEKKWGQSMVTILSEHQRRVVFRLGRVTRVAGPGAVWRIPMVDRVMVVDLNRTLPGWRGLSEREIEQRVQFIVLHYPEVPVGLSESELSQAMEREAHGNQQLRSAIESRAGGSGDRGPDRTRAGPQQRQRHRSCSAAVPRPSLRQHGSRRGHALGARRSTGEGIAGSVQGPGH